MHSTKILLADDHDLIRAGLRDSLSHMPDLEVVGEVGNGPDLFAALENLRPDFLVMDINMPDFEPVDGVVYIKATYPDIKILVVSAYADQSYVVGLLSAGVNGYHLKDQPLSDLQLAVQRILNGGRWISDPLVNRLVDQHTDRERIFPSLSRRQRELLYLLSQGYNNHKIALVLDLSVKTVENHLTALYRAIGVGSRLEASIFATLHAGLLALPQDEKRPGKADPSSAVVFTALVVDDNPRYRTQLGKLIRKTQPDAIVYEVEDTQAALHAAKYAAPHLAFVDVVLRDEDGIACTQVIKKASPSTRVILVSAYPDREFRRMGFSAGAVAFLDKKDLDAATVRQLVEDAVAGLVRG